jgi:peptidoglycan/LPS O-acetylase OafA/YrhL
VSAQLSDQGSGRLGWSPALDGLRAIAVLLVMLFHYGRDAWLPGGFLGVDIFFVLSGFLITTLLLQERERSGTISLSRFYARRGLRLVPGFATFLAVYLVLVLMFPSTWLLPGQDVAHALRHEAYGLGYIHNWVMASGERSPHSFGHIWTLGVEMQFYLLWPAALLLMLRCGAPRIAIVAVTATLAFLSAISLLFLGRPSWELMYYGTQFRAHELLIGALAAQLFVWSVVKPGTTRTVGYWAMLAASTLSIAVLARTANEHAPLMFTGGYQLTALAAAVVILHCVLVPDAWPARVLAWRPLAYVGRRSYAIYLWHLPVGYSLRALDMVPEAILATILTVLIAEASYRLIERPALRVKSALSAPEVAPETALPMKIAA